MVARRPGAPPLHGVVETALYVEDVARSAEFYARVLGLRVMGQDQRMASLDVGGRSVLLLFQKTASREGHSIPGGFIPGHEGDGRLHYAFAIDRADLELWAKRLAEQGVEVESRVKWPRGGESLYFRDPDGHAVELVTPGVWETY